MEPVHFDTTDGALEHRFSENKLHIQIPRKKYYLKTINFDFVVQNQIKYEHYSPM